MGFHLTGKNNQHISVVGGVSQCVALSQKKFLRGFYLKSGNNPVFEKKKAVMQSIGLNIAAAKAVSSINKINSCHFKINNFQFFIDLNFKADST
ncbi:hypothetical protein UEF14_19190 [Klebsiella michiganensis]|uniref:hypothetical protein n=1 Tax=Klebsiella michiganensis TaxID=1134687 RepID=UPI0039BF405A